jgi:protein-L-isoaspartate(D-aspartate) O-methyltransferase
MTDFAERRRIMVDGQVRTADVTRFPIIEAMLSVPRELYVPAGWRSAAYAGENVELAPRRVILEPRTMAKMLDALDLKPDQVALDVGCGLGYSTALLARLAEAVVALEEDEAMAREAEGTLAEQGVDNAAVIQGPLAAGAPRHGPYDAIMIEGAAERLPPAFADQLKEGGRIACLFMEGAFRDVDGALGAVRIGYKIDGALTWRFAFNAGAPVLPGFESARSFVL